MHLPGQECTEHTLKFFGLFDLRFMSGIEEAMNPGARNHCLELLVPVLRVQQIVGAGNDEKRNTDGCEPFYEGVASGSSFVAWPSQPRSGKGLPGSRD